MNQRFAVTILSAAAVFFTGCINSTTTLTVQKNGAGTIEERSLADGAFVKLMNQLSQGFGKALGQENSPKVSSNPILQSDAAYRDRATALGQGVSFVSAEEISKSDGSIGALVRYRFDDVTAVQLSPQDTMRAVETLKSSIPMKIPGTPEIPGADAKDAITFGFKSGDVSSLTINLPDPGEEDLRKVGSQAAKARTPSAEELAQARQMIGDMGFALIVAVDGEVVSSDATHKDGNAATLFSLDLGEVLNDPDAFAKLKSVGDEKDFDEVKRALQDVEGVKFETKETVEVRFK